MSVYVSGRVWKKSKQRGSALVVMLAIADFSDPYGVSWPLVETIAEYARIKTRNAQYILTDLEGQQEILRIIERGRGKQSFTILTAGLRHWMVYRLLRQHPEIQLEKAAARQTLDDWIKGAIEHEKVQALAPFSEKEKVQAFAPKVKQKVQSSVVKGAIQRNPYKEEPSGTVNKTSARQRAASFTCDCGEPVRSKGAVCSGCASLVYGGAKKKKAPKAKAQPATYHLPDEGCVRQFVEAYVLAYGFNYQPDGGDVAQYRRMRSTRNGEVTQETWRRAVANFFSTPRASHRLRELCSRFPEFHATAYDQYGKPCHRVVAARRPEIVT